MASWNADVAVRGLVGIVDELVAIVGVLAIDNGEVGQRVENLKPAMRRIVEFVPKTPEFGGSN